MFLFAEVESTNWIGYLLDPTSNALNYLVFVVLLLWGWNKWAVPAFKTRKEDIDKSIANARRSNQEAKAFLAEQREKVANAEKETASIVSDARKIAEQMSLQMEEQTKKDLAELEVKIKASIINERQLVITELRAQAVKTAIKLCEAQLAQSVTEGVRSRLLTQFMGQLDSMTHKPEAQKSEVLQSTSKK